MDWVQQNTIAVTDLGQFCYSGYISDGIKLITKFLDFVTLTKFNDWPLFGYVNKQIY